MFVSRYLTERITESLGFFPAVLLLGARQIGKSTLAKALIQNKVLDRYVTLDEFPTLMAFTANPDEALLSFSDRIALDEIQRVPDLMRALKKNIDEYRQKGRFLLTGSANVLSHPKVTESLAGRIDVLILEGFGPAELKKVPISQSLKILLENSVQAFKDHLLNQEKTCPSFSPRDLQDWLFFGGYPEVIFSKNPTFKERYFQAYQMTYLEKDMRDLAKGIDIVQFAQVAKVFFLQSGNLLNIANVARDLQLDQRTIKRYLELMELTFQIVLLPPWSRNTLKKIIKTPKVYARDTGLMTFMHRVSSPEGLENLPVFGAALETFLYAELRRQFQLFSRASLYFYRTHAGREVDFVLEHGEKLVGIELKASTRVHEKDFAGLADLEEANNGNLTLGIVLYSGNEVLFFDKNKVAVPLRYLLY